MTKSSKAYKEREASLYVMRFFIVLVMTAGGAAGFALLSGLGGQVYSTALRCFGLLGWLFAGFVILLFVNGMAKARGEMRDHKHIVRKNHLDQARAATIHEGYTAWNNPSDQLLIISLTKNGRLNQLELCDDFETGQQLRHLIKHKRRYERLFNVRVNFSQRDLDEWYKRTR